MKKIILALCIGFFCTLIINHNFQTTEKALANSVLRLHVIANSDSAPDQELKLKVRDRIIREAQYLFEDNKNSDEAKLTTKNNLLLIEGLARDEIERNGYSYEVKVSYGKSDFPTKEYGNFILPAGSYDALRVEIGKARGKNWWCVLFPPLCFVDESCVSSESDAFEIIRETGGEELEEFVKKEKSPKVELKFKSYEIWQKGKKKLASLF